MNTYFRKRMALNHLLSKHLRRGHSLRQSKYHSRKGDRGTIKVVNGRSIHKRPKSVETRKAIGHWEGDLVSGSKEFTHCHSGRKKITLYHFIEAQR